MTDKITTDMIDMYGKECPCKKGTYQESSIFDDMRGILHCSFCGQETNRWWTTGEECEFKVSTVKNAEEIARKAHKGQTRWDKKTPYIVHPERIASKFNSPLLKAAAWLHDVVEDTSWTFDDLREANIPESVIKIVDAVTKREGESYKDFILRIRVSSHGACALKEADIRDNLRDLKKGSMRDKYELALWVLDH